MQLLRHYGIREVANAIEKALEYHCVNFESIKMLTITSREPLFKAVSLSKERLVGLPRVHIEDANTGQYQALLTGGES